jgi:cholesterol 7-dehydrogenase
MMLERDIGIWNQKSYMDKPLIVKEDTLISKHRRWYSQFYSKDSKKFAEAHENLEF